MYYTLCRVYRDTDGPMKEKEDSKPSKGVIWEHVLAEFIPYCYNLKGYQESMQKAEN